MVRNIKTFFVMILFVFFGVNVCKSQWTWQNPSPFGTSIYGSCFVDVNTGYACCYTGQIMKTTNGGVNWTYLESGTRYNLRGIYFTDANTGTAVGYTSKIIRTTNGGTNWYAQHIEEDTTEAFVCVRFINSNTGFVGGIHNRIYKTTNGGTNWVLKTTLLTNYCVDNFSFLDANTGISVGRGISGSSGSGYNLRKILRTTNAGESWDSVNSAFALRELYCVDFINGNLGLAGGGSGYLIRTTDGGLNWTAVTSGVTNSIDAIHFFDTLNVIVACGSGKILRSTNGGLNWTSQSTGTSDAFYGLSFPNATTGIVTGGLSVYRTTNGGTNWTSYSSTRIQSDILEHIHYVDENNGTAVGDGGTILHTTNGGTNWVAQTCPVTDYNFSDVHFVNPNTGFAVGSDEYKSDKIFSDNDFLSIISNNINFSSFKGSKSKTKSKTGGIFAKTTNGGTTWTVTYPGYWVYGVYFTDANTGWMAGTGPSNTGGVYKTTNGGTNWTQQTEAGVAFLYFADANTGFACGWDGIYHTTNGGVNWEQQFTNTAYRLSFINANTGWTSINNYVYHTTDGGKNWITQNTGVSSVNDDIAFSDSLNGVVIYSDLGLYTRTTDGGNTWSIEYTRTSGNLWGACYNSRGLTIVGNAGNILFNPFVIVPSAPILISPSNGALNQLSTPKMKWSNVSNANSYRMQISTDSNFASVILDSTGVTIDSITVPSGKLTSGTKYYWRVNSTNSIGTSSWSTIFNFTVSATGISSTASELPKEYKLYNNYPNPFNPTTKIKFDIPKNGLTKIAIYDVLGREMKTLINENLVAGSYAIEWNATSFASGIYFYKMTSSGYTSIKKMALIK
jgi:photosystem II stability/assembly factor-like uncharacterized protein